MNGYFSNSPVNGTILFQQNVCDFNIGGLLNSTHNRFGFESFGALIIDLIKHDLEC